MAVNIITKKTIQQEYFDNVIYRIRGCLEDLPMTKKERDEIEEYLMDVERKFEEANK